MKRMFVTLVLVVGVMLGASRSARACGSGGGSYAAAYGILLGAGAVDVGFSIYDLASAGSGTWSRGAGVAEVLLVGPQAALLTYAAFTYGKADSGLIGLAAWTSLLTLHGLVAIASPSERARPVGITLGRRGKHQVTFAPTIVSDGKRLNPALGAVGYF
jgi:hypothetical protein